MRRREGSSRRLRFGGNGAQRAAIYAALLLGAAIMILPFLAMLSTSFKPQAEVFSHPGDLFYVYTQGTVTRYSTNTNEDDKVEKWMGVTAEYASGSSGSPLLNKYGAVVGMAALTLSLDASDDAKKPVRRARPLDSKRPARADDKKDDKTKPKEPEKPDA